MEECIEVRKFRFSHHCGTQKLHGYLRAQTHVIIHVPGKDSSDEGQIASTPPIAIPVGDVIKNEANWGKMTIKREKALRQALPESFKVKVSQRADGKWYSISYEDILAWIDRAQDILETMED